MKTITRYLAQDGSVFDTEKKCREYESLCKKVKKIMKPLGKLPLDKGCKFANGEGYIQHNPSVIEVAKSQLLALGKEYLHIKEERSFGFAGRCFDDYGVSAINDAHNRLSCCDENGREWGQQYFAVHPEKGKQHPFVEAEK